MSRLTEKQRARIREIHRQHGTPDRISVFEVSEKKLRVAKNRMANGKSLNGEEIILVYDSTLLRTFKAGLLVTDQRVYLKEPLVSVEFTLEDIVKVEPKINVLFHLKNGNVHQSATFQAGVADILTEVIDFLMPSNGRGDGAEEATQCEARPRTCQGCGAPTMPSNRFCEYCGSPV